MSWIREGFIIAVIFGILFLTADYFFGNYILNRSLPTQLAERVSHDKCHQDLDPSTQLAERVSHDIYHHDLGKNIFKITQNWGELNYELCTNGFGFKSSCDNTIDNKDFDIVFIGDSFTEGIGLDYEDTFVGLFADSYPELRVANMGVSSYSPSIYRSKIQYYLEKEKMIFDHVFIFIDISDIQDEAIKYERLMDNRVVDRCPDLTARDKELLAIGKKNLPPVPPETQTVMYKIKTYLFHKTPLFHLLLSTLYHLFDKEEEVAEEAELDDVETILQAEEKKKTEEKKKAAEEVSRLTGRGEWTYTPQSGEYGAGVQFGIDIAIHHMEELYKLLKERNIKLSIGIYPWPNQLKYDVVNNLQTKIWRDFCKGKCSYFINTMPAFFKYLQSNGYVKTYQDLYFYGDVHFNKNGNRVIFEEIKKTLPENTDEWL